MVKCQQQRTPIPGLPDPAFLPQQFTSENVILLLLSQAFVIPELLITDLFLYIVVCNLNLFSALYILNLCNINSHLLINFLINYCLILFN